MLAYIRWGVLLCVVSLCVSHWLLSGWVIPYRVQTNSMAETLLGQHLWVTCPRCGHEFPCDRPSSGSQRVVCRLCGSAEATTGGADERPGDRIWIDRAAFALRSPRRWEAIVLRDPSNPRAMLVKRVVGLPGEAVSFDRGNLVINGRPVAKAYREQLAVAQTVFDLEWFACDRTAPRLANFWPPEPGSGWRCDCGVLQYAPLEKRDPLGHTAWDWIHYRPHAPLPGLESSEFGTVNDLSAFHQTMAAAVPAHPVEDLSLRLHVAHDKFDPEGRLAVRVHLGDDWFELRYDPAAELITIHSTMHGFAEHAAHGTGWIRAHTRGRTIYLSVFDRQFLAMVDGEVVCRVALPVNLGKEPFCETGFSVGAFGGSFSVQQLIVARDVAYFQIEAGETAEPQKPTRLGGDEYFVVGDNAAVSIDGRHCPSLARVSRTQIVGRPLAWRTLFR